MKIQVRLTWVSLVTQGWLDIDITLSNKGYVLTETGGITMQLTPSLKAFYAALKA